MRWLWLGLGLAGVATLSATTGALLAVSLSSPNLSQRQLSPDEAAVFDSDGQAIASAGLQFPQLTRPVNILVLGVKVLTSDVDDVSVQDQGYHALVNSFEGLSDTMLLVRFDPSDHQLSVLSIPRDTRTWVEGVGITKINAANSHGGPALSAQTTSELLNGVAIDRYIRINVQGVEKLVDALGGVTVFVPKDMRYQDDSQHLYINLKAGEQRLNGAQALQFLRFRYDEYGDIGRVQRQQTLMRAIKEQALSPATLLRLPKILSVVRENLDTNLSVEEIAALIGFSTQVERDQVQMMMVPGEFGDLGSYGGVSYWVPHENAIARMMAQHFDVGVSEALDRDPLSVRIAIQDSTGDRANATAVAQRLQEAGYRNVFVAQAWPEPLAVTRAIAQNGDTRSAAEVRDALQLGEVRVDSTGYLDSDVTIQIGQDWLTQPTTP
jgi:LCP family protein required for cell wall assembly